MSEHDLCEGTNEAIIVDAESSGERIDKFLSVAEDISRSRAVSLIEDGCVLVGGRVIGKNYKLSAGDEISISYPEPVCDMAMPEDIPLDIVYEDTDIIVVNKPSGMIVHPATGIYTGTLVNALLYHCKESLSGIGGVIRPGIVHRIDKDTSGLLVVAKNDAAHLSLAEQLKTHTVSRIYHAVALGNIKEENGTVAKPIGRHPTDRKKMAIILSGEHHAREAVTHYSVIERFALPEGRLTYVKCKLETGRTHQIRVHMSSIGHPLLGDQTYGGVGSKLEQSFKGLLDGQCLHAKELELIHPRYGESMHFECELPQGMNEILKRARHRTVEF